MRKWEIIGKDEGRKEKKERKEKRREEKIR